MAALIYKMLLVGTCVFFPVYFAGYLRIGSLLVETALLNQCPRDVKYYENFDKCGSDAG